jgi:hypothetical protein
LYHFREKNDVKPWGWILHFDDRNSGTRSTYKESKSHHPFWKLRGLLEAEAIVEECTKANGGI